MNGQRRAGDKELLTVRLRQSCDLAGRFGVTTVFPKGNFSRFCRSLLGTNDHDVRLTDGNAGARREPRARYARRVPRRADGIFEAAGQMAGKRAANAHLN
jgi:hypothetical protein